MPVGDFRIALASEFVPNIAEVERNDRVVPVQSGGEIVKPLGQLKIPLLLAFLRSGKDLVGVNVGAFERKEQLTVSLRQTAVEHLHQLPPRSLRKSNFRQAHPPLLERERGGDDPGKRRALRG